MGPVAGTVTVTAPPEPLLGRHRETEALSTGLDRALQGHGGSFLVLGPGGMGKTRLLRWFEQQARSKGFQVRWGGALKEAIAPFFAFEQIFRQSAVPGDHPGPGRPSSELPDPLPPLLVIEEERPRRFRDAITEVAASGALLLASRESSASLRERTPSLPPSARHLWITRMEGEGRVTPGNLDRLGELASEHLQGHPGGVVALEGLEYLASQTSFASVLRLFQFLRDVAMETDGHLIVALNPDVFEKREVSLLESDADVLRARESSTAALPAADDEHEPASERLLRYLGTLERWAEEQPQAVVVDDLHWVDPQSGTAFQFLARNLADRRVVIVGGAREDEIPSGSEAGSVSLLERLDGLVQEGSLARVELRGFGEAEAVELARQVLSAPLAPGQEDAMALLIKRGEGNPYFLRETLLQLREEGALRLDPDGYQFVREGGGARGAARVPSSLRRLVLHRLTRLSPEDRAFLDTAAVAGSEFDLPPVAAAGGRSVEETARAVERLHRDHRLLEPAYGGSGDRWIFSHPLVWEVTVGEMSDAVRRGHARTLLKWWSTRRPEDIDILARLGHDAADRENGLPWVRKAFDEALSHASPESAATYLGWAHDLRRSAGRRPSPDELHEEVVAAREVGGHGADRSAARFLDSLLQEPLDEVSRWDALAALAFCVDPIDSGRSRKIEGELFEELTAAGPRAPARIRNALGTLRGYHAIQEGDYHRALQVLEPVAAAPPTEVERPFAILARLRVITADQSLGRTERIDRLLAEVDELGGNDLPTRGRILNIRALEYFNRGDYPRAVRAYLDASASNRRAGLIAPAMLCSYNAANILISRGEEHEEVDRITREVLDLGRKFDLPRLRCVGNYLAAKTALIDRRFEEAERYAVRSQQDAELMGRRDDIVDCLALRAQIAGDSGDLTGALAAYAAMDHERAFHGPQDEVQRLPRYLEFLEAAGERAKALEIADRLLRAYTTLENPKGAGEIEEVIARLKAKGPAPPRSPPGRG